MTVQLMVTISVRGHVILHLMFGYVGVEGVACVRWDLVYPSFFREGGKVVEVVGRGDAVR